MKRSWIQQYFIYFRLLIFQLKIVSTSHLTKKIFCTIFPCSSLQHKMAYAIFYYFIIPAHKMPSTNYTTRKLKNSVVIIVLCETCKNPSKLVRKKLLGLQSWWSLLCRLFMVAQPLFWSPVHHLQVKVFHNIQLLLCQVFHGVYFFILFSLD